MLKAFVFLHPPVQWRGGQVCYLYKGSGLFSLVPNYRDVTLADGSGKQFGQFVRKPSYKVLCQQALEGQYGSGLNSGSIEFTHLHLSIIGDVAISMGLSFSFLFVDVVCAFASLVRVFVLASSGSFDDDQVLIERLSALGMNRTDINQFLNIAVDFAPFRSNGLNHLLRVMSSIHEGSWISFEFLHGVFEVSQGCLAGTPLADLLFCFFKGQGSYCY